LAENDWQLFAARVAVGLGEACLGPAVVSLLADYFRPAQRGRAMGTVTTGGPIGSAGALFFGGMMLSSLTQGSLAALVPQGWAPWQIVFLGLAAPGLLTAALVSTLKEPPRRGALATSLKEKPKLRLVDFFRDHPWAMAAFFGCLASILVMAYAVASWAPTLLMRIYGMQPSQVGAIYGPISLFCSASAAFSSGFVSDALVRRWRLGGRVLIPLIALPVEIGVLIVLIFTDNVTVVVSALAVSAFTGGFVGASFHPAVQDLFPNQLRGRAAAVISLVGNVVGLAGGSALVALVTDHVFRDDMMLQKSMGLVGLAAAIVALLLALGLPRLYAEARRKELGSPQPAAPAASAATATARNV
jgi:MFS family permease